MKAALLYEPGPLVIEDVQVADVDRREVRIRTMATGLCHSDLHFIEGKIRTRYPVVMGHEAAGMVEAVGPDVTHCKPGDAVITFPTGFCGTCVYCLRGRQTLCDQQQLQRQQGQPARLRVSGGGEAAQFAGLATFAEEMLVHENSCVKVTADVPFELAALVGCGVATGLGAVLRRARVQAGENVAVIGCGGIGLNAIQGAVIAGAGRILAIDVNRGKLDRALRFGATDAIDNSAGDAVEQVRDLLPGTGGVDHSFEAIGLATTCQLAFEVLRRGGSATIIGMMPEGELLALPGLDFMRQEKRLQGTMMGSISFRDDLPFYLELYKQGRLHLDELVSARIPLSEINDGYARIGDGGIARSVVMFN
jgi:S-(hydroxymethyl)glutathione dehydrogenase/alcohol dehydrogenase